MEYISSVPDDSRPLRRCLDNPELTDAVLKAENSVAVVLWLAVLWLKYKELIPEVQEQLETVTKEIAESRGADLDMYLSLMDYELKKAGDAEGSYWPGSVDPVAVALRTKIYNLRQARVSLVAFKSG